MVNVTSEYVLYVCVENSFLGSLISLMYTLEFSLEYSCLGLNQYPSVGNVSFVFACIYLL